MGELAEFYNQAIEFYKQDNLPEAVKCLKKVLEIDKKFLKAHLLLAQAYQTLGQVERSILYLNNVLKINPNHKTALGGIAMLLYETENYTESLKMVDKYLSLYPNEPALQILKTDLLSKQGNYKESLEFLNNLTKTEPKFTAFTNQLQSWIHSEEKEVIVPVEEWKSKSKKKLQEFKKQLQMAQENPEDFSPPDPQVALDLSLLYLFQGDSDRAMKYLVYAKKAVDQNKDSEES